MAELKESRKQAPCAASTSPTAPISNRSGIRGWEPLWAVAEEAKLPVHLHTIGGSFPDFSKFPAKVGRAAFATLITSFQMYMAIR